MIMLSDNSIDLKMELQIVCHLVVLLHGLKYGCYTNLFRRQLYCWSNINEIHGYSLRTILLVNKNKQKRTKTNKNEQKRTKTNKNEQK